MNILVTGGAGFIGSHACKALARAGFTPVTYDNLSRGHAKAVKWGPLEHGDIRDGRRLEQVLRRHDIRAVMHFAALAYVAESFTAADEYFDVNVSGAWSLLQAMHAASMGVLVFSSSCAVYGVPDDGVCDEDSPTRPINPYGASKAAGEQLLRMHGLANGLRWLTLRYFNAAGADSDGDLGEDHDPETHLIPLAIRAALPGGAPLSIYGRDYPTADGSAERDYVHVTDIAEAHVAALHRLLTGAGSDVINLCAQQATSVLEICAAVKDVLGVAPRTMVGSRRPGDPPRLLGSGKRAAALLGWRPQRSNIHQIIDDAARWRTRHLQPHIPLRGAVTDSAPPAPL